MASVHCSRSAVIDWNGKDPLSDNAEFCCSVRCLPAQPQQRSSAPRPANLDASHSWSLSHLTLPIIIITNLSHRLTPSTLCLSRLSSPIRRSIVVCHIPLHPLPSYLFQPSHLTYPWLSRHFFPSHPQVRSRPSPSFHSLPSPFLSLPSLARVMSMSRLTSVGSCGVLARLLLVVVAVLLLGTVEARLREGECEGEKTTQHIIT